MDTINGKLLAFLSPYSGLGPHDLKPGMNLSGLTFLHLDSNLEYWKKDGYTLCGKAEVTFSPMAPEELITGKIDSLRAQKTKTLADAHAAANEIEKQINQLLTIGFDAPVEVPSEPEDDDPL